MLIVFFLVFFIFLFFEFSSCMGFKFRVLINFARIYFRGSIAKNAKLCIPIRNIIKPICVSVSLCHPHTFHARLEFFQNYFNVTQRDLYSTQNVKKVSSHQRRKTTIFLNNKSSASLEKLGSKNLNKQKTRYAVTGFILPVTKQGNKADHWKWSYWQGKCSKLDFVPNFHFPVPRARCRLPFPRFCKVSIRMHWLVQLLTWQFTR